MPPCPAWVKSFDIWMAKMVKKKDAEADCKNIGQNKLK